MISIHALREEGDQTVQVRKGVSFVEFLSTPSARRATCYLAIRACGRRYFYPRPPRGGRQYQPDGRRRRNVISIHALREEGDRSTMIYSMASSNFYPRPPRGGRQPGVAVYQTPPEFLSTPSARRATHAGQQLHDSSCISIHALREEGDQEMIDGKTKGDKFLSTPSARRATV